MPNIDDLQQELQNLESENIRLYQEAKSIFGWPLCGERPPTPECFTEEEFEEDAKRTMEVFLTFVRDLNIRTKRANTTVKKRFNLYAGEQPVDKKDVVVGKPVGDSLMSRRVIDI